MVTRNSEPKGQPPFLCTPSIFFCRGQGAAVTGDEALVDDALDCQGDTARRDANLGKRSVDNCALFRFDVGVPGISDLVQEPAQSAMSPDEAGSGLLCILPEVHGTAAGEQAKLLPLSTHLPSPGGDPDQYEEEQSGKHIAGVYIFEAGPAGWTGRIMTPRLR